MSNTEGQKHNNKHQWTSLPLPC